MFLVAPTMASCRLLYLWVPSRITEYIHKASSYPSPATYRERLGSANLSSSLHRVAVNVISSRKYGAAKRCHCLHCMHPTDLSISSVAVCVSLPPVSCCLRSPADCRRFMKPLCVLQSVSCTTSTSSTHRCRSGKPAVDVQTITRKMVIFDPFLCWREMVLY